MSNTSSVMNRHYCGMAGYRFNVGDNFVIEPSMLVNYVAPAPVQFDAGVRAIYKEKFWMGGSYRNHDAFAAYIGFLFRENLMLGYAYDFTTTDLGNYSTGTHELILGVRFNKNGLKKGDGTVPKFD